jgi:spore coat polysaccharide biosynthesis protein SpsF
VASGVTPKTAIVLQARMGSRRLPGKVLAAVAGRTILAHCVERLRASGFPVVLATTVRPEDDVLEAAGDELGLRVVRGPADDVLARYVMTVAALSLTDVVRATADNPAVDIDAPARVLGALRRAGADYATETGLPYGTAVEAMTADALARAASLAETAYDREHVTPLLQRDPRFTAVVLDAPPALRRPDLRLTVDTAEDLAFVERLFASVDAAAARPVPLAGLLAATEQLA